jgi:signal peptidase I
MPSLASGLKGPVQFFRSLWQEVRETAQTLAIALLVAVALHVVLFQPFTIPSSSMEPGLVTGDYIVVSKFAYGWSRASLPLNPPLFQGRLLGRLPARGDVVVFRLPRDPQQTWIKRVIGLPGDRVRVTGGQVFVNDQPLAQQPLGVAPDHDDPMRIVQQVRETGPSGRSRILYGGDGQQAGENTATYIVPPGDCFVMGDNRDNSLDSRWPAELGVGFLPIQNIVGKAQFVLASWRSDAAVYKPWTWLEFQPGRWFMPVR